LTLKYPPKDLTKQTLLSTAKAADTNAAAKSFPSSPISKIPARSENNPARQTNNNGVARRSELSRT
jgi:hypothetical protein